MTPPPRPRPHSVRRRGVATSFAAGALGLALCAAVAGCGEPTSTPGDGPGTPMVATADTGLVGLLADLHVLEARRALATDTPAAQSLRPELLARRGYDADRLRRELDALAADPDRASVTWLAVQDRVDALLRGPVAVPPPSPPAAAPSDSAGRPAP